MATYVKEIIGQITWQHLTFIFALVFIFLFRQPLSGLIGRITKIDKEGLLADSAPAPEVQREKKDAEAVQQLLDVVGNSAVISELETRIKNDINSRSLSLEDSVKVLIRHLAGTQLLLSFEQIHSLMFGSQLQLLKRLNETAAQGRSISYVSEHINGVKLLNAPYIKDWSDEQYLDFLFGRSLIARRGDQIYITPIGVEYLTWVARNGRSENNPL